MLRHYFISNDLDDLQAVEDDFYKKGFSKPQLHVLSERDSDVVKYKLHEIDSLSKSDIVHGGLVGAVIGIAIALVIMAVGLYSGAVVFSDWIPFFFLAVVSFCFCVWEGGLFGIQVKNIEFRRFEAVLQKGKHILMIDHNKAQDAVLREVIKEHPKLEDAGTGAARPWWFIRGQKNFNSVIETLP